MNGLLIAQLLVMHVLGDFVLQPDKWVRSREEKHFRSPYLYLHAAVHISLVLLITMGMDAWWIALPIGLGHLLFDGFKSYWKRNDLPAFILDQLLHVLVIIICACILSETNWIYFLEALAENKTFWSISLGYLLVVFAYPRLISFATKRWRKDIPQEREVLVEAGRWIGIIERVLVLTFVLINQFSAIGFLLGAKSVLRFGDLREAKDKGHTEYVMIGTLLSFGITILTGLGIRYLLIAL